MLLHCKIMLNSFDLFLTITSQQLNEKDMSVGQKDYVGLVDSWLVEDDSKNSATVKGHTCGSNRQKWNAS